MMTKLMHMMFLSCMKATELIEKKMYFKISRIDQFRLHMHKMMCKACTNYEKQSIIIDKGIDKGIQGVASEADIEQLKSIIHAKLIDLK